MGDDIELSHPLESGGVQRRLDYWTGRHDEREFGEGARAQAELAELARLHRAAVRNVHRVAMLPARDRDADRAAAVRRDAWFAEQRERLRGAS